ncbi:lysozyme inhibitor LprI family protein [Wohlfahrtiimonas populi]|uniref:lysozyme inhibitor LprI family protein n=1 Tax=Wohlfahrtiimonas populi TaxID=1940240 RepID=UPI00098CF71B|nr:lysozyme inhibitor LprI family protein [Wohlfahrtiimonas populi]
MKNKILISIILFRLFSFSYAEMSKQNNCNEIIRDKERLYCLTNHLKVSDFLLNSSYQKLQKFLDKENIKNLKNAQLSWLSYRDKDCSLISSAYLGGTLEAEIETRCITDKNVVRTEELNKIIDAWSM